MRLSSITVKQCKKNCDNVLKLQINNHLETRHILVCQVIFFFYDRPRVAVRSLVWMQMCAPKCHLRSAKKYLCNIIYDKKLFNATPGDGAKPKIYLGSNSPLSYE